MVWGVHAVVGRLLTSYAGAERYPGFLTALATFHEDGLEASHHPRVCYAKPDMPWVNCRGGRQILFVREFGHGWCMNAPLLRRSVIGSFSFNKIPQVAERFGAQRAGVSSA